MPHAWVAQARAALSEPGVVAAGHPQTAEAGAAVLRAAATRSTRRSRAVLASFAVESPLTGLRRRRLHDGPRAAGRPTLIDFFVAAPGLDGTRAAPSWRRSTSTSTPRPCRRSTSGRPPAGCRGRAAGLDQALRRFGTMPLEELVEPAVRLARDGAPVNRRAGLHPRDPGADPRAAAGDARALRAGGADAAARGRRSASRSWPRRWNASPPRARSRSTAARSRRRCRDFVVEHGGTLGAATWPPTRRSSAQPVAAALPRHRGADQPAAVRRRDADRLLARRCSSGSARQRSRAAGRRDGRRQRARGEEFAEGLYERGPGGAPARPGAPRPATPATCSARPPTSRSVDADGMCAAVTCSNGSGSGVLVPGTGVILNNMLGEEDLNPVGFHRIAPGERVPSMMAPTVVLRDGEVVLGGRQRRLQPDPLGDPADGGAGGRAGDGRRARRCAAPRLHFEAGIVQAEPGDRRGGARSGSKRAACRSSAGPRSTSSSAASRRSPAIRETGALSGGGDPPRRRRRHRVTGPSGAHRAAVSSSAKNAR